MSKPALTVLHSDAIIELYYTLYPFLISELAHKKINFVYFKPNKLKDLKGKHVLFTRIFKGRFDDQKFVNSTIDQLQSSFNNVFFLDDSAGADSTHFEFIKKLDGYYKAKLLTDKNTYKESLYGRQVFSDYYHQNYKVFDGETENIRKPVDNFEEVDKLKPAFNLGYGWYPKPGVHSPIRYLGYFLKEVDNFQLMRPFFLRRHKQLINKLGEKVHLDRKIPKVSARFRFESYPNTIGYQRLLFEQIIHGNSNFLTGIIPQHEYLNELRKTFATLSPFGYGEVCVRDFECIINGSLLIKPDMSHLVTKPDIYKPNETYIPFKWDGSDLLDVVDNILTNPTKYYPIVENARSVYRKSLIDMNQEFMTTFGNLLD